MVNITNIFSPLDQFELKEWYINIYELTLNNYMLYAFIVTLVLILLSKSLIRPNSYNLVVLGIYDTIYKMYCNQKIKSPLFFPLLYTIFNLILICNLVSLIPYSYAITTQFIIVIYISVLIWLGNLILGVFWHRLRFVEIFIPDGTPLVLVPLLVIIELISYFSTSISLGLRLSSNILSGHILMAILGNLIYKIILYSILAGILPFLGIVIILILEFSISIIQSYVFTILFSKYISDSINLH